MIKLGTKEISRWQSGKDITIDGFSPTEKAGKGSLFMAMKVRILTVDFIGAAVKEGAAAVLCRKAPDADVPYILVDDTKAAYQKLAAYYRQKTGVKVVGITGSVGKTTTKDFTYLCFSAKYNTFKTQGNLNNDIGVPATLLSIDACHQAAVVEMGMNHAGEISLLSKIAASDAAIITNVGVTHIENLGSRENILKAKLEILDGLKEQPLSSMRTTICSQVLILKALD